MLLRLVIDDLLIIVARCAYVRTTYLVMRYKPSESHLGHCARVIFDWFVILKCLKPESDDAVRRKLILFLATIF